MGKQGGRKPKTDIRAQTDKPTDRQTHTHTKGKTYTSSLNGCCDKHKCKQEDFILGSCIPRSDIFHSQVNAQHIATT